MTELEDLRRWNRRLSIVCIVLAVGVIASVVGFQASESSATWSVKRAYERGLDEGTVMKKDDLHKAYLAGATAQAQQAHLSDPAPTGRGPLDLSGFTTEQIRGLRCYIQSRDVITGLP